MRSKHLATWSMFAGAALALVVGQRAAAATANAAPRWANDWGLELGLRLDAFVTQGRTFAVDVASDQNEGIHGINYAFDFELAYAPPLPAEWRLVSIAVGIGYTPFFGTGYASFAQYAASGDSYQLLEQRYRYDWSVHLIPINAGLRLGLPLARLGLDLPIRAEIEAGFAGGFAFASSTLTVDGADAPFAKAVGSSDFGLGYYAGALINCPIPAGLGSVTGGYRYSAVRLDFHRPDFNATWGDLGGHHVMVGYRFEL